MDGPALRESDVSRWVGAASYDRGRRYARDGAIGGALREGDTLRATCAGSYQNHYLLWARLGPDGVAEAECDCPVGDGGRCKHVAALLLTWLHHPEAFVETAPLADVLAQKSPDQLAALVRRMVERHPDLADLVATPTPGSGPLDGHAVERQVRRALSGDLYEWGSAVRVGRDLRRIAGPGDAYAAVGDWASVVTLCDVLLDNLLGLIGQIDDENGDVGRVVDDAVDLLGRAIEHAGEGPARAEAVRMLADVMLWDVQMGGVGTGDEAGGLLAEHAAPAEKAAVGARVDAALDRADRSDRWGAGWHRQALGGLRLLFLPDAADDETRLRILRDSGRTADAVAHLLERGRLDDALAAAAGTTDYELLGVLTLFVDHGHGDAADALALDRLSDDTDRRLVDWIKTRARDRGDGRLARDLAERLFWDRPSLDRYVEVLALSATLGREDEAKAALRTRLRSERAFALLTETLLHDGEPDEALALLRLPAKAWPWPGRRSQLRIAVAESVARSHPDDAAQLYLDAVEGLVEQRGRTAYAQAARLLVAVRQIYRQRGRADDWALLLGELREATKPLRAFRDEMNKAGL